MIEMDDFKFFRYMVSSNIRSSVLISLMDGSKGLSDLQNDVDGNSRNLLKVLRQLIERELVTKDGRNYSLTNSGRLLVLNIMHFVDDNF